MPASPSLEGSSRQPKRACDQCRRAKTKCEEGEGDVCKHCLKPNQPFKPCTYNDPPLPKGPKPGSKGSGQSNKADRQSKRASQLMSDGRFNALRQHEVGLLTPSLVHICYEFYHHHVQSAFPILDSARIKEALACLENDEVYVQLCAFCAYICLLPAFSFRDDWRFTTRQNEAGGDLGRELRDEAKELRKNFSLHDNVSPVTISTSLLISESCRLLGESDMASSYAQEATTLSAAILHWPDQAHPGADRLIFCTLYIHERLCALQSETQIAFSRAPPPLGIFDHQIDNHDLTGFRRRLEILKYCVCSSGETVLEKQGGSGSDSSPRLPEQYETTFMIALQNYCQISDLGDRILDFGPAVDWLRNGLRYILENYESRMQSPHSARSRSVPPQDLGNIARVLLMVFDFGAAASSAATYIRDRLQPILQNLSTQVPPRQQVDMPAYVSPMGHADQAVSHSALSIHHPISPMHPTRSLPSPSSSSRNSSVDAAIVIHAQSLPSMNSGYQTSAVPVYQSLIGNSMDPEISYGYQLSYTHAVDHIMGNAPS